MDSFDRQREQALLAEIFEELGAAAPTLPDVRLTGFLAMKGDDYIGDLMWVGRAVNGWRSEGRTPAQLAVGDSRGFVAEVLESVTRPGPRGQPCPMRWVSDHWGNNLHGYNTKTSAFWRTAARVMKQVAEPGTESVEWPSRMIWSNLYKVAPAAGGNPGSRLAALQLDGCRRLLALEVAINRPRNIVFATGADWASALLDPATFKTRSSDTGPVMFGDTVIDGERVGRFVVAKHPMGKDENQWVEQVATAFGERSPD